jgi:hypothetical protein
MPDDMTIPELARITLRAAFAMLFPALLVAALAGASAGVAVATYRFTVDVLT